LSLPEYKSSDILQSRGRQYNEDTLQEISSAMANIKSLEIPSGSDPDSKSNVSSVHQVANEHLMRLTSFSGTPVVGRQSRKRKMRANSESSSTPKSKKSIQSKAADGYFAKVCIKRDRKYKATSQEFKETKFKFLEEFRQRLSLVLASPQNAHPWGVILSKMKSLREDSLAEIAEADLRALVEIVQSQQPDPPNLVEALSFGKEDYQLAACTLNCTQIILYILAAPSTSRTFVCADSLNQALGALMSFFETNIISLYKHSIWMSSQAKRHPVALRGKDLKKAWRDREAGIRGLFSKANASFKLLIPIIRKGLLRENHLNKLMRVNKGLLKVSSQRVASLQQSVVLITTAVCSSYPKRREDALELIMDLWSEIARADKGKISRSFALPNSDGEKIQVGTALLLSIFQAMPLSLLKQQHEELMIVEQKSQAVSTELKKNLDTCFSSFSALCQNFMGKLIHRITGNMTKCTSQSKNLLLTVVDDLLTVLALPEWPSAEFALLTLCRLLVKMLQSKSNLQQLALDSLGDICAKVKRNVIEAGNAFVIPDEVVDFDQNADPTHESEDASCICDGGKDLPETRRFGAVMLDCDSCHRWFHAYCMGIKPSQLQGEGEDRLHSWICDECQIREEVKRQQELLRGSVNVHGKIDIEEILQQLHINYLTMGVDSMLSVAARQFVILRWVTVDRDEGKDDPANLDYDITPNANQEPGIRRAVLQLLSQWQPLHRNSMRALTRESTIRLTKQLQKSGPLARHCNGILSKVLKQLSDKAPKNRERVLKVLSKVTDVDPSLLEMDFVRNVIKITIKDVAKSVRSAAIDLVGKYISNRPQLSATYFDVLLDRFRDTGPSVRKKVMKILRTMGSQQLDVSRYVKICIHVSSGIFDDQETIRKEVIVLFEELWFSNQDTKVRAEIISRVVNDPSASIEQYVEILQAILKAKPALRNNCMKICSAINEKLLTLEDNDKDNYFIQMGTLVTALKFFCDVDPKFVVSQTKFLQPNLSFLCDFKSKDSNTIKLRSAVMSIILDVIKTSIPSIQKPYKIFLEKLTEDLKKIIKNEDMTVLRVSIPCVCAIAKKDKKHATTVQKIFFTFFKFLITKVPNMVFESKTGFTALRSLFCIGLLAKHFDDFQKYTDKIFLLLLKFCKSQEELFQRAALQGLFFLFSRAPDLMNRAHDVLSDALKPGTSEKMHITILRSVFEFLEGEDKLVTSLQTVESKTEGGDEDEAEDQSERAESVIPTVMQNHLKSFLRLIKSPQGDVRYYALMVIRTAVKQGLVNPIQCIPFGICTLTDTQKRIRDEAVKMVQFFNEKRPIDLRNRALYGIEECYDFQRCINRNFDPFGDTMSLSGILGGLQKLYRLISPKKADRDKLLRGLVEKMKSIVGGLSSEQKQAKLQDNVKKVAFLAVILANLPYDYDEPLLIVFYVRKVVGTEGAQLYEKVSCLEKKKDKSKDICKMSNLSVAFSVLLDLEHYMKDAYQLNDDKCNSWSPYLSNKASTARCGRKQEALEFGLDGIAGYPKKAETKQLFSYFLRAMEKDSVSLQVSYRKKPRKSKKRKKKYTEEEEDPHRGGDSGARSWKEKEDKNWVPGC